MGNKPKLKELIEGTLSCPGCSTAIHIADYQGLEVTSCPQCDAPLFIPFKLKNYWLYKPLGGGGMGSVYQALSEDTSGEFAVKILPRGENTNPGFIDAITREGEIGIILGKAPNIAEVVESGCEDGEHFLASQFVEGTRLDVFISTASHLSERQALDIILQVIDAEIHIINCGFLYRDIKPENIIIVEETVSVKVFDFGLCLSLEQAANPNESDALEGSPYYLPPERIVAAMEGEHSEIYSLGMLLFHMLAGTTYFSQSEIKDLLTKHVGALRVASVSNRLKHCSPGISVILDKMIKRNPNQRYHELTSLKKELEDLCNEAEGYSLAESKKISAKTSPIDVSVDTEKKSSKTSLIVLLVILFIVAVGVGSWHAMNIMAENTRRQEILTATASRLGIASNIKPPDLTLNEVKSSISEKLDQEYNKQKGELAPFNETLESAKICKQLSVSVSMKKDPKYTITQLNRLAASTIRKDVQRKLAAFQKPFSEKKVKEKIAKELGITLPATAPMRTLKEVQNLLSKDADKAARDKYSSKEFASETMAILKKYRSYKKGDKVSVMDQAGLKLSGTYRGREGNKILIGNRKIMLSDIIPSKRVRFNEVLCSRKASEEVKRVSSNFKKKRKDFKAEYLKKTEKGVYKKYGYVQEKNKWIAVNEIFILKLQQQKQKFDRQRNVTKKKIEQSLRKAFNKDNFFKKHGYCKVGKKWLSEKVAVAKLLKEKKNIFKKKRNKILIKLKADLKKKVEKEVYQSNRYIYYNETWQPAATVFKNECSKALFTE
jgi:serine/threonine protein kinase